MPFYGGSVAGGYSGALDAMSQQRLRDAETRRQMFALNEMQKQAALRGPTGATLLQLLAQQQQGPPPMPTPQAPMPGQQSVAAQPPPMAPPYTAVPGAPGTPRGMYSQTQDLPPPPDGQGLDESQPPPVAISQEPRARQGALGIELPPQPRGDLQGLGARMTAGGTDTTTGGIPGVPGAPGMPGGSAAPPMPGAPAGGAPGQPRGGIPPSTIAQSPGIVDLIRAAKAAGVPQDQMIGVLDSIHPLYANEYKAVIGAQNAAIRTYEAIIHGGRADADKAYHEGRLAESALNRGEREREADQKATVQRETEAGRNARAEQMREMQTKHYNEQAADWAARRKQAAEKTTKGPDRQKFDAEIQAARDYITMNPLGSEAAKGDFGYATKLARAMTKKLGIDDPDYEATWKAYAAKGKNPEESGFFMGLIKGMLPKGQEAAPKTGEAKMRAAPETVKPMPKVGDVVNGYRFMGGDPNDQNSWRKQ